MSENDERHDGRADGDFPRWQPHHSFEHDLRTNKGVVTIQEHPEAWRRRCASQGFDPGGKICNVPPGRGPEPQNGQRFKVVRERPS